MKILMISIAAPPKSGAESLQVAKYIKHLAHKNSLTLVTTPTPKTGWKKADLSQVNSLSSVDQVISIPTLNNRNKYLQHFFRKLFPSKLQKPDSDYSFHEKLKKVLNLITEKPDIIYSRSTPFSSAVLAYKIKHELKVPWVMHMSDPWVDSPYGSYNNNYNNKMEQECFQSADLISFTTPETLSFYSQKYPHSTQKFILSPNVFDKSDIDIEPCIDFNGKMILLYSGNLYGKRNLNSLIISLQKLSTYEHSFIELWLAGNIEDTILSFIKASNLNNIKILGSLPHTDSMRLQKKASILLSVDKPVEKDIDKVFLPSKIQDYLCARKKILALTSVHTATWNIIKKYKCGESFQHNEIDKITSFLKKSINEFRQKNIDYFITNQTDLQFDAEFNGENLIRYFKKLITNGR